MADSEKQKARNWIEQRKQERGPPPSQEEIRRQMGWDLVEQARKERERREKRGLSGGG
jgi:hypothetical protein